MEKKKIPNLDSPKRIVLFPEDEFYTFSIPLIFGFITNNLLIFFPLALLLLRILQTWKLKSSNQLKLRFYWYLLLPYNYLPPAYLKIFRG